MKIVLLLLTGISIIYGALNIITGCIQLRQKKISYLSILLMIVGGLLIIIALLFSLISYAFTLALLIFGLILIHTAAIFNGIKLYGKINPPHHIVRLVLSIIIVVGFLFKSSH